MGGGHRRWGVSPSFSSPLFVLQLYDGYFVHFFAPTGLSPIPKDIVFVIDVSGSMSGTKMKQVELGHPTDPTSCCVPRFYSARIRRPRQPCAPSCVTCDPATASTSLPSPRPPACGRRVAPSRPLRPPSAVPRGTLTPCRQTAVSTSIHSTAQTL